MGWLTNESGSPKRLEAIARYFGLGEILSATRLEGYANKNYLVITSAGDFVVKIILNHQKADLEQEILYLKRLEEYGFPAAYYLPSPHGSFLYQDEEVLAVVMRKKEGQVPERSEQVNQEIGAHLARLHLLPVEGLPPKPSWLNPSYLPEALSVARQQIASQDVGRFLQAYETVRHFQPAHLPQSIIHGDVTLWNCLFLEDRLVALLDWEEVTLGASLVDIAMSILMFCFIRERFLRNACIQFLKGYTSIRPFTEEEYAQLETAIKYAGLTISTYFLLQFTLYYPDNQLKNLQEFYWRYQLDAWTLGDMKDFQASSPQG
jgi:Ser/Thr protein kinase RdoA (MazF antagonist)